ncbi:MAG: SGNH/GDSL hydrolase family protein [Firmicutes bacterium]|nr:SGNH/GDSL hydrolase family protein [Bacillota bacterium]
MSIPAKHEYLEELCTRLAQRWPDNRTVNIVCHGHSVPAGYAATPWVDTFHAYPHLVHRVLKQRFPFAVINMIVTAIGGENSRTGAARFESEVLCHRPDLIILDYGLNDRGIGLAEAEKAWRSMIEKTLAAGVKMILMTPSWDQSWFRKDESWQALEAHAAQERALAAEYGVALGDSFAAYEKYIADGGDLQNLLSHVNHPSPIGHELIAREITGWFVAK